jgi:hypothetical protein
MSVYNRFACVLSSPRTYSLPNRDASLSLSHRGYPTAPLTEEETSLYAGARTATLIPDASSIVRESATSDRSARDVKRNETLLFVSRLRTSRFTTKVSRLRTSRFTTKTRPRRPGQPMLPARVVRTRERIIPARSSLGQENPPHTLTASACLLVGGTRRFDRWQHPSRTSDDQLGKTVLKDGLLV